MLIIRRNTHLTPVAIVLSTLFHLQGALVYFMQTGFAMLCAGSIRAKNVKNVILCKFSWMRFLSLSGWVVDG